LLDENGCDVGSVDDNEDEDEFVMEVEDDDVELCVPHHLDKSAVIVRSGACSESDDIVVDVVVDGEVEVVVVVVIDGEDSEEVEGLLVVDVVVVVWVILDFVVIKDVGDVGNDEYTCEVCVCR
jgi:hypothetical protein